MAVVVRSDALCDLKAVGGANWADPGAGMMAKLLRAILLRAILLRKT
jgi:hypothetical protein